VPLKLVSLEEIKTGSYLCQLGPVAPTSIKFKPKVKLNPDVTLG